MPKRMLVDADGIWWEVWEVQPTLDERRRVAERRRLPRNGPDRRSAWTNRPTHPFAMRHGWLAFQCAFERRRLSPFPDDWSDLDDPALRALLRQAKATSLPRPQTDGSHSASPRAGYSLPPRTG